MAETLNTQKHEALPEPEHHELLTAHAEAKPRAVAETAEQHAERLSEARHEAQAEAPLAALGNERLHGAEQTTAAPAAQPHRINRELQAITERRELQMIRRKLSAPQRTLSRVIHQPAVRVASEAAGKTVSRPSGLLGGGIVAFIGTSAYLYLAHHIGFRYNSFVFLVLFAGGFCLGVVLELIVHLATKSRHSVRD